MDAGDIRREFGREIQLPYKLIVPNTLCWTRIGQLVNIRLIYEKDSIFMSESGF